ncbi:MAG: AMP-binding protein, partial [Rubrivivax sp.]|nr:AMP-binding protein [Rubrivivax sp.]
IDDKTGEILVRGPNVFVGYLNQPEKTAETIDADGWLHTGDVGTVDEEGVFRITDRMKDIIITAGGKNVTPSEWENELKFSPTITDAVVIGNKAALPHLHHRDRPGERRECTQDHDVPFKQLCQPEARAGGARAGRDRDRQESAGNLPVSSG